jgi:hypothetical protein
MKGVLIYVFKFTSLAAIEQNSANCKRAHNSEVRLQTTFLLSV